TTLVQKLLCCIIRTDERFGTHYIIDILLGSRNKRIMENCHNTISTWGIGTEISKSDWLALVDLLIHEDFLCKAGDFQILTITPKGRDLLSMREKVLLPIQFTSRKKAGALSADGRLSTDEYTCTNGRLSTDEKPFTNGRNASADFDSDFSGTFIAFPKPKSKMPDYIVHKKNKVPAQKPDQNDAEAEEIVKKLKAWRKRKADEMNIPPYIIFGDKTMFDIAAKKPQNKDELLNVYGMGNTKVENFGQAILRIVLGE
ncbi:MAG: HRDC domain-containing protein, partial [Treponema sp.]|nr:HRDC domain-containing protein [Treponema sp.]